MENKKNMNIILAVVICLILAGVLVFISIKNKTSMNNDNLNNNQGVAGDTSANTAPAGAPVATPAATAPATANTSQVGQVAKTGDTVTMNYTGKLADGTVFDSNTDPKFGHVTPFIFTLGAGQVIPGWDKGIVGMKVGETKTLVIPPADAYGATGQGPIPPNATLTFEVELLAIK